MFTHRQKPEYVEELISIWRPRWDAVSLLGEGYSGSSLSNIASISQREKASERTVHQAKTMAAAKRDVRG